MRGILPIAAEWVRDGRPFAMATLVAVSGSAPREVGASMIVSPGGEVFGNVSGGCVEGAVFERCLLAIESGDSSVETFGYSTAEAFAVGLSCGGAIEVLVRPILPGSAAARDVLLLAERESRSMHASYTLTVADADVGRGVIDETAPPASGTVTITLGSPPRLVIVGAVEFAVALSRIAVAAGMRVTVVDPREVFATPARFPGADVIVEWPHRYLENAAVDARTAVCVLTHDPKFDVPALRAALASDAGYVGVMGSRRTHEERLARLVEASVPAAQLARLRSPIGLDLGGRSPEETAISILAEIVADRHGGSGRRLTELSGPVHQALGARVAS